MSDALVLGSRADGVVTITLNRADKRNALTRSMIGEIRRLVDAAVEDQETRLLVLKANGKAFCAGMDLGEMQSRAQSEHSQKEWEQDSLDYQQLLMSLFHAPFPTVAVVHGASVAGGMGIVLACDMTLCGRSAFFALPEPMRGITASMVTPLLTLRLGTGHASYFLLSGERVPADRALQMGLCFDVVPDDDLPERQTMIVKHILTGSPQALMRTKAHLHACVAATMDVTLDASMKASAEARESDDAREGLQAFLEKRHPNWVAET